MTTWKLSIKPRSLKGYNSFNLCMNKKILGIGWSEAYSKNETITNLDLAKDKLKAKYKEIPYAVKKLMIEVKTGDFVWIHQGGHYYLCKVESELFFGRSIDIDFLSYDLGHARKAKWVRVPEILVSGTVQRGTIASRLIQKINISSDENKYQEILFDSLTENKKWIPKPQKDKLENKVKELGIDKILSLMTSDEVEDIIAIYLQEKGWRLLKSTCFRSKPKFEFSMQNKNFEHCSVQVKSGNSTLKPSNYTDYVSENNEVFLFSAASKPYDGKNKEGVTCLSKQEIYDWLIRNSWAITIPLQMRLMT